MLTHFGFLRVKAKPQLFSKKFDIFLFLANVLINRVQLNKSALTQETI
jgi:hypothetical protein